MELKHFFTTIIAEKDILMLFDIEKSNIVTFWERAYDISQEIAKQAIDKDYKDSNFVLGSIGELFLEALVKYYPTRFNIKVDSLELPTNTSQKGYDAVAKGTNGNRIWLQMKFHCPHKQFGEDSPEIIHQLDSFISSTTEDGQIYRKNDRILVTTGNDLHYRLGEIGYQNKLKFICLQDLKQIVGEDLNFWADFKQACLDAKKIKSLPSDMVVLRLDQAEDVQKIQEQIHNVGQTLFIAPTGSGKTEVAAEVIKNELAK